jgi:hypothetical protein
MMESTEQQRITVKLEPEQKKLSIGWLIDDSININYDLR